MPNSQTDFLPYLLLAVVVLVGGLVAYVADSLGRKIGKKRLSFMGLRPRYTATLIIVIAGILVPLLTIIAIYAMSSDVREWIQRGRNAISRAQKYEEQVNKQKGQIDEQTKKISTLTNDTHRLQDSKQHLTDQLKKLRETLAKAKTDAAKAQKTITLAQQKMRTVQTQLAAKNRQIAAKEAELHKAQVLLHQNELAYAQVKKRLKTAGSQLAEIKDQALKLDRQNEEFEKTITQLKGELEGLQKQKEQYESQVNGLKESITAYQSSIRDLTSRINELQDQRDRMSAYLDTQIGNVVISRTRPLIFDASEELARIQLPPSLSPVAARNAFFDLLQRARSVAIDHKSKLGSEPAGLAPQNLVNPLRHVTVEQQQDAIIRGLTAQRNELVFIARAAGNTFEGEYVLLDFVAFRNRVVYTPGKLIAETKVDGRKSEVEILNAITQFIQSDLRAKALADGMIPPSGRFGTLGIVSSDEMLNLIHQVKETNQIIRLQAMAKDETKAGDQIELSFRIRYGT